MMTPCQKIQRDILLEATAQEENFDAGPLDTPEQVEDAYSRLIDAGIHWDYESDFRGGQVTTDILCDCSRHYESRSVARRTADGSWVGWTYWYGGGKYAQPGSVPWMKDAYNLTCVEETKTVVVRTFTKA